MKALYLPILVLSFKIIRLLRTAKKYRVIITFSIKGESETYNCPLEGGAVESASLSITSNKRQHIRYTGALSALAD